MMGQAPWLFGATIAGVLLALVWSRQIGLLRGSLAALCRVGWVVPVIWTLSPETITDILPSVMSQQPIHVLLDDSRSMRAGKGQTGLMPEVKSALREIEDVCRNFGCMPKIDRLSEIHPQTAKGFTPLSAAIEPWLFRIGAEPWIVLTDGADWRPARLWDERLKGRGAAVPSSPTGKSGTQGLVVAFGQPSTPGFWLEQVQIPSFAFEGQSNQIDATVIRTNAGEAESVQVQAIIDGKPVAAANAEFAAGMQETHTILSFPSPGRGAHLISVKSLPVGREKDVWDNEVSASLEVLPNTLGILHLLGAPSWDGRFLRRYLKAEPKFDLISFFILRDPWDSQAVNERELSLIPFPVERLFNEELASFRVLILQNFSMQQFLQPEYQKNLVKFVLDGGGLLFIGGPRALTEGDLINSPMSELLPFAFSRSAPSNLLYNSRSHTSRQLGTTYDNDVVFDVHLANPDLQKRALANVYEDWSRMSNRLTQGVKLKGMHRMQNFQFKEDLVTPLLEAKTDGGDSVPLAVASYPGKGRALWLFTDNFWKLAMSRQDASSRFDYNEFFDAAMTWLMRGDRRPPLIIREFAVERMLDEQKVTWRARISGPAAPFIGAKESDWSFHVCDRPVQFDRVKAELQSTEEWLISGEVGGGVSINPCSIQVFGQHPAFGSVKATALAVFSDTLPDEDMSPSPRKVQQLAELTGARFVEPGGMTIRAIQEWLQSWTGVEKQALPNRFKTIRDFYWVHRRNWVWLVILLLPLEVLVRRWHLLAGSTMAGKGLDG